MSYLRFWREGLIALLVIILYIEYKTRPDVTAVSEQITSIETRISKIEQISTASLKAEKAKSTSTKKTTTLPDGTTIVEETKSDEQSKVFEETSDKNKVDTVVESKTDVKTLDNTYGKYSVTLAQPIGSANYRDVYIDASYRLGKSPFSIMIGSQPWQHTIIAGVRVSW